MNNLPIKNSINTDFTITASGDAFISMAKTAQLCGITKLKIQRDTASDDTSRGLSPKILSKVIRINAIKGVPQSIDLLDKIMEAGAKAFIYYHADIPLSPKPKIEPLLLEAKEEIIALKTELKKARNTVPLTMSSSVNRKRIHEMRIDIFKQGCCDKITKESTRYFFPVNNHGLMLGYKNTGKYYLLSGHMYICNSAY